MLVIVEGGKREKYLRFVDVFEVRIKESQVCTQFLPILEYHDLSFLC